MLQLEIGRRFTRPGPPSLYRQIVWCEVSTAVALTIADGSINQTRLLACRLILIGGFYVLHKSGARLAAHPMYSVLRDN